MNRIVITFLCFFLFNCSSKKETNKKADTPIEIKTEPFKLNRSLTGLWSNSDTSDLRNGNISIESYFMPCTAIMLKYDSLKRELTSYQQYGEQFSQRVFKNIIANRNNDSIKIFSNDSLLFIFIESKSIITFVSYLDSNVYGKNTTNSQFIRLFPRYTNNNDFQNNIVARVFNLFPLKLLYNGALIEIENNDDFTYPFLKIKGFQNFDMCQIINVKVGHNSVIESIECAFTGKENHGWHFYNFKKTLEHSCYFIEDSFLYRR
jgi:hypothetical protein